MLHRAGGGLITLIRYNITFTTTELQMVKVHINNTKHITIANIYIPPRDSTSTHSKTADTDIRRCIKFIRNIPHSVHTGDVGAHSTLWHSWTDDHGGQVVADVIGNSDHMTLNMGTPARVPDTTRRQMSPRCLARYKQKTQRPSRPLHKHTTYFNTIFNNGRYTTNIPTAPTQS